MLPYGKHTISSLNSAVASGQSFAAKLTNKANVSGEISSDRIKEAICILFMFLQVAYYGKVCIGSHNQSMEVQIDIGSADLWVPSSHCQFREAAELAFKPCRKCIIFY